MEENIWIEKSGLMGAQVYFKNIFILGSRDVQMFINFDWFS